MATGADKAVGYGMVSLAGAIFTYYTLWVVFLPFVDDSHVIHEYFLPRIYAVLVPIVAGVIALTGLGIFITMVMLAAKKAKQKAS